MTQAPAPTRLKNLHGRRWQVQTVDTPEEEGWLLTYLDVITLLLVMMVVMLSFSQPASQDKAAAEALQAQAQAQAQAEAAAQAASAASEPAAPAQDPAQALGLDNLGKDIQVSVEQGIVRFRISSEILFDSGQARLVGPGPNVLESLVPVLRKAAGQRVIVEGHTDNVPIQTDRYPSNWELSSARASSVARFLIDRGIEPTRVRVSGLADTQPIADNRSTAQRAGNRRVELILETVPGTKN